MLRTWGKPIPACGAWETTRLSCVGRLDLREIMDHAESHEWASPRCVCVGRNAIGHTRPEPTWRTITLTTETAFQTSTLRAEAM